MRRVLIGPDKEIKILQWNCNGVRKKRTVLKDFMYKEKIDIAFLQESHLNPYHKFDLGPDYVIHRKDRRTHKGKVFLLEAKLFSAYKKVLSFPHLLAHSSLDWLIPSQLYALIYILLWLSKPLAFCLWLLCLTIYFLKNMNLYYHCFSFRWCNIRIPQEIHKVSSFLLLLH